MPPGVFVPAFAKVNLTLDVLGRRPDGYHRLASVMQTIALYDTLLLRPNQRGEFSLACDVPTLANADNLALRAARLLATSAGTDLMGVDIDLRKEVPAQAGLGGGSGDAAAVLASLNALWALRLPASRLEELGARLGSDVPFFIQGGTTLIEGRGEIVTPLPDVEPLWLVLVKPDVDAPTADVFRALVSSEYSDGVSTQVVVSAVRTGQPVPFDACANALTDTAMRLFPQMAAARDALRAAGAPVVLVSGSGPTLVAPFHQLSPAAKVYDSVVAAGRHVWLTRTVTRGEVARSRQPIALIDHIPGNIG